MTQRTEKAYGTGKRKCAVARVWLSPGTGNIIINGKPMGQYLPQLSLQERVREPLERAQMMGRLDVVARASGGGPSGQADAIRHGIARALVEYDEGLRPILRQEGLLTRDPRVKERKKYGRKRARRGFQFSKR